MELERSFITQNTITHMWQSVDAVQLAWNCVPVAFISPFLMMECQFSMLEPLNKNKNLDTMFIPQSTED